MYAGPSAVQGGNGLLPRTRKHGLSPVIAAWCYLHASRNRGVAISASFGQVRTRDHLTSAGPRNSSPMSRLRLLILLAEASSERKSGPA